MKLNHGRIFYDNSCRMDASSSTSVKSFFHGHIPLVKFLNNGNPVKVKEPQGHHVSIFDVVGKATMSDKLWLKRRRDLKVLMSDEERIAGEIGHIKFKSGGVASAMITAMKKVKDLTVGKEAYSPPVCSNETDRKRKHSADAILKVAHLPSDKPNKMFRTSKHAIDPIKTTIPVKNIPCEDADLFATSYLKGKIIPSKGRLGGKNQPKRLKRQQLSGLMAAMEEKKRLIEEKKSELQGAQAIVLEGLGIIGNEVRDSYGFSNEDKKAVIRFCLGQNTDEEKPKYHAPVDQILEVVRFDPENRNKMESRGSKEAMLKDSSLKKILKPAETIPKFMDIDAGLPSKSNLKSKKNLPKSTPKSHTSALKCKAEQKPEQLRRRNKTRAGL